MIYDLLAPVYDKINRRVPVRRWADFITATVAREFGPVREPVLDLACGTGKMTVELAKRGYDMIGVDLSPQMLNEAMNRARRHGVGDRILWLCQNMTALDLYGTVDCVVSCMDSINHLTGDGEVEKCFSLVHNFLSPGGLFLFDVNGKHKFEQIYACNSYVYDLGDSYCVWENHYSRSQKLCTFDITLFVRQGQMYERYDDSQTERMYTVSQLCDALQRANLAPIGVYSDFKGTPGGDEDDRIIFVAKCIK